MSTPITPEILQFLQQVKANNNRDWFNANKAAYKAAHEQFKEFAAGLLSFAYQYLLLPKTIIPQMK